MVYGSRYYMDFIYELKEMKKNAKELKQIYLSEIIYEFRVFFIFYFIFIPHTLYMITHHTTHCS